MIDTLTVGQRIKVKLRGKVEACRIAELDQPNSMCWAERAEGLRPRRIAVSYPMIFAVWDQWNEEWVVFRLPSEEQTVNSEVP